MLHSLDGAMRGYLIVIHHTQNNIAGSFANLTKVTTSKPYHFR